MKNAQQKNFLSYNPYSGYMFGDVEVDMGWDGYNYYKFNLIQLIDDICKVKSNEIKGYNNYNLISENKILKIERNYTYEYNMGFTPWNTITFRLKETGDLFYGTMKIENNEYTKIYLREIYKMCYNARCSVIQNAYRYIKGFAPIKVKKIWTCDNIEKSKLTVFCDTYLHLSYNNIIKRYGDVENAKLEITPVEFGVVIDHKLKRYPLRVHINSVYDSGIFVKINNEYVEATIKGDRRKLDFLYNDFKKNKLNINGLLSHVLRNYKVFKYKNLQVGILYKNGVLCKDVLKIVDKYM